MQRQVKVMMLLWVLALFSLSSVACAETGQVQVKVNGKLVHFPDSKPYIDKRTGRTIVPIRFIAEQMGAEVRWDGRKNQVIIKEDQDSIVLPIGESYAWVNGKRTTLDAKAVIQNSRTFVPLRFISEALGASVEWMANSQTVLIDSNEESSSEYPGIYHISIGQSANELIKQWGEPQRKDFSPSWFEWWIYNKDLDRYLQVGIKDGQIIDIYSLATTWDFSGINVGSTKEAVTQRFNVVHPLSFQYDNATFTVTNSHDDRVLLLIEDTPVVFYLDQHNGDKVAAIRLMSKEMLVKSKMYSLQYRYTEREPNLNLPTTSDNQKLEIQKGHERQILDLTNVTRLQHHLAKLSWNEQAAQVARKHSLDMFLNQFFDHTSATTGLDPFQRMDQYGLQYRTAGENIAAGYLDAIEAHHGWMNSIGHRKNILNKDFTTLGVGVADSYYTQNFVTP